MKLSIIIPVYNSADNLKRTLEASNLKKLGDYKYEIIIVDDGSFYDGSFYRIKDFIQLASPRINYIYHEYNRGAAASRNTGLRSAKGEYIQFIDAGDIILEEKLNKQVAYLDSHKDIDIVFSDFKIIHERYNYIEEVTFGKMRSTVFEYLLEGNLLHLDAMLFKKHCLLSEGGFDESLPQCEDWDLWIRLSMREYNFAYLPGFKAYYIKSNSTLTQNMSLWLDGLEKMIEKLKNDPLFLNKTGNKQYVFFSSLYFLAAWRLQFKRKYLFSLKYYKKSLIQSPGKLFRNLIILFSKFILFIFNILLNKIKIKDHCCLYC